MKTYTRKKIRIRRKKSLRKYRSLVSIGLLGSIGIFIIFFRGSLPGWAVIQNSPDNNLVIENGQYCEVENAPIQVGELLDTGPRAIQGEGMPLIAVPTPSLCYGIHEVDVEIYMYHYVRPTRWDAEGSVVWNNSVTPEVARDHYTHLGDLQNTGTIHIAFLSELQEYQATNCFPHTRIVILTFDDGWWDNYNFLLPLAKEFDIKANLGIIGNRISRDEDSRIDSFMTFDEIVQMKESGYFELHGHSKTHTDLQQKSYEQQWDEICTSTKSLEDIFDISINSFIYPMGLYNTTSMDIVRDCGITYGLTTREGVNTETDLLYDRYQLYRKRVSKRVSPEELFGI